MFIFSKFHIKLFCRWPEVYTAILIQQGKKVRYQQEFWDGSAETVEIFDESENVWLPFSEYKYKYIKSDTKFMKKHYLLVTRIFDERVRNFLKNILLKHNVMHYAYRIEFQVRGMPHVHGILWLNEEETAGILTDGKQFDLDDKAKEEAFFKFCKRWNTCSLPDEDDDLYEKVMSVNRHKCYKRFCKKNKDKVCRFGFPKFPCKRMLIARPNPFNLEEEDLKVLKLKAEKCLRKVKEALINLEESEEDIDLDEFLAEHAGVKYDEYENYLRISERGNILILERTIKERNINNFHPTFLRAWNANMDLQICLDTYAVVTYITDYLTKGDIGFTKILKQAIQESKGFPHRERLNYVKRMIFISRQVSVAEATYRLIPSMRLKFSDISTKFVQSGFPQNRSVLAERIIENEDVACAEDDNEHHGQGQNTDKEIYTVEGREGLYSTPTTIHEQYSMRPKILETIFLGRFAILYLTVAQTTVKDDIFEKYGDFSETKGTFKDTETDQCLPRFIKLLNGTVMRLRTKALILRMHSSKRKEDLHEQLYAEMLIMLPWRMESELYPDDFERCRALFNENEEVIKRNRQMIFPFSKTIEVLRELIDNEGDCERAAHIGDILGLDVAGEQENIECEEELANEDNPEEDLEEEEEVDEEVGKPSRPPQKSSAKEPTKVKPIQVGNLDKMMEEARNLSYEQKVAFNIGIHYCKTVLTSRKRLEVELDPPLIIVTGKFKFSNRVTKLKFINYDSNSSENIHF